MKIIPSREDFRKRLEKLAEQANRQVRRQQGPPRWINTVGLKRWYMSDEDLRLTPYAKKEKARRRAARKVAHESRRVNFQRRK